MFKMIIGSDLVPTDTNFDLFEAADVKTLAGDKLLKVLEEADFRIFNLEPLATVATELAREKLGDRI